jgi:P4 family phage/plasmid primase-like protien
MGAPPKELPVLDGIVPQHTDRFGYATMYLEWGWHLFVLGAGRTPLPNCDGCRTAGPEHNPEACLCLTCHGFYAATSDRDRLELMMTLHPAGHLAVRTGSVSDIVVIDAEGDADGDGPTGISVLDGWEGWVEGWSLPTTLTARTPSGGVHLYYRYTESRSRNRVLPAVDVKSNGGYVLIPQGDPDRGWLAGYTLPSVPSPDLANWLATARGRSSGGSGGPVGHGSGYDYRQFAQDGCPGGHRDEFFNDMCFRLRRNGATKVDAEQELRRHWGRAAQPPDARWFMPWEHVAYKIERVWRTVDQDPEPPSWRGGPEPLTPEGTRRTTVTTDVRDPEFTSDLGNAQRFIRLFGQDVRFVAERQDWIIWDGSRWIRDMMGRVRHLATKVADDIRRSSELTQDPDETRALVRWALQSESLRAVNGIVGTAAVDPRIAISVSDLNRNPLILAVKNGVLDLRSGELKSGARGDYCTQQAAVAFDPVAQCPRWRDHIKLITKGDVVLASYLRRAIGYSLTGLTKDQVFFMLEGTGANGKNAFIEPILDMMGDYAQVGTSALITGGDEQHPTILADLVGARMIFIDEARQGRPLNVERVKQLTGSAKIKARRMSKDFFEFDAQLKLWIAGNNHPTMKDPSDGIWRRLHRVIFPAKIPAAKKITDYARILYEEEASGILNWALEGLRDYWQLNGLGEPQAVVDATQEVREEEDVVGQWIADRCDDDGITDSTVNSLYIDFMMWCTLAGIRVNDRPNRTYFGRDLSAKGYARFIRRIGGSMQRGYTGLKLLHPIE